MSDYFACHTAFGWVAVAVSDVGLVALSLPMPSPLQAVEALSQKRLGPEAPSREIAPRTAWHELAEKLQAYFEGQRVAFDQEPIDWRGVTPFYRRVWSHVQAIPWGTTQSYGQVAAAVGAPQAARAIGSAMANNRLPIVVPCHRVLGARGQLVGFGGGLEMKARMLAMEGIHPSP